jgi:Family of unknown function (DUF6186)
MIVAALHSRFVTDAGLALIAAVALTWEILSTLRVESMTVQRTIHWAMGSRVVRLLFLAFWIWVGWHLFARGSGAFQK